MTRRILALCEGRHEMPSEIEGSVYGNTINPLDVSELELEAKNRLQGITELTLYVTGLTVALVATLNACKELGVKVVLMHYNRDNNSYYPQSVA